MSNKMDYVFDVWTKHMKETPGNVVLSDSLGHDHKRKDCDIISARVYSWLHKQGFGREDFILINLDRGVKSVLAAMGVWKNGSAFSMVESTYAKERIAYIKNDCGAVAEINEDNWDEIMKCEPLSGYERADDHDAAMLVYTSGTTGTPKGVLHEYGQIRYEMLSEQRPDGSWRENLDTRWGLVAPLNFVASLKILVHFLYCGGHLYILDYDTVKNPRKLNSYFLTHRINETFLSPSILRLKGADFGPFMKYIYTGAEPANNVSVNKAELNNTYTMSESFFTVCEYIIDKPYPVVPIGKPMFDLDIKLLDENGEEVKPGELGEFCYYDPYCRGYINNKIENDKHFIDGWFHTGDLAVYKNGMYTLMGRSDDMIKIDGNRIEPSEIEAVCAEELKTTHCAAKGFEEEGVVVLYYTGDLEFDEEDLRKRLENKLPYYMIPAYFVKLERLPISQNGKLDRKALRMPARFYKTEYVEPRNEFEASLCRAFEKTLGMDRVGIKDDFFKLGGNSIKAMELLGYLEDDEDLTPTLLYKGRTVENISALYEEAKSNYLTPEEKEEKGRTMQAPVSEIQSLFWNDFYDCSLDFYFGLKINPFVNMNKIAEAINRYIDVNSTFNLVIRQNENGEPIQEYNPEKPYVSVEKMSYADAKKTCDGFVRKFQYDEPLIRIRIIKTNVCSYFLFHGSHAVMDGAACHNLIVDMMDCIKGKDVEKTNYFAYVYDENRRNSQDNYEQNLEYFRDRYFSIPRVCSLIGDAKEESGTRKVAKSSGFALDKVESFCKAQDISANVFILAAVLLAEAAFNDRKDGMVLWNYHNRGKGSNRCGVMYRSAIADIDMNSVRTPRDVFDSINKQNEENFWRLRDHDYYRAFSRMLRGPKMTVSYLEGWFTDDLPKYLALFCSKLKLHNNNKGNRKTSSNILLTFAHFGHSLTFSLKYSTGFISAESAERFTKMLEYAMKELLAGRLPDYGRFK